MTPPRRPSGAMIALMILGLVSLCRPGIRASESPFSVDDWSPALAAETADGQALILTAGAWGAGGLAVAGQWSPADPATVHLRLGDDDPTWTYPRSGIMLIDEQQQIVGHVGFAAGAFLPTAVLADDDGLWVGGYAGAGFAAWLKRQSVPGLRHHDPDFRQRDLTVHTPGEHHDEPRRDPALDARGAPAVLRLAPDGRRLLAAALLEGWQSTWFVPAQVRETWWQPLLFTRLADGDLLVVHDGGMNRLPEADHNPRSDDFAAFCLAVDHVSRLAPDLDQRRWHRSMHGPPIDAAAISATIAHGIHFRNTRAREWTAPVLGNPRSWTLVADHDGRGAWVGGWSASRTNEEPWWCPFIRHIDGDGQIVDGPWSPSPTGGDGRLGGQVSDTAVRALATMPDGGLMVILLADGGNNVAVRDPWDPLRRPDSPWFGSHATFRGRTLFWSGLARLHPDPDAPLGLGLAWGRHLGGQGRDRRDRHTTRPAWGEHLVVVDEDIWMAGRVADQTRILNHQAAQAGGWLVRVRPDGSHDQPLTWPQTRITSLVHSGGRILAIGWRGTPRQAQPVIMAVAPSP